MIAFLSFIEADESADLGVNDRDATNWRQRFNCQP